MKQLQMKNFLTIMVLMSFMLVLASCNLFKPKYGCPTNGKNIGAEKLASWRSGSRKSRPESKKIQKLTSVQAAFSSVSKSYSKTIKP